MTAVRTRNCRCPLLIGLTGPIGCGNRPCPGCWARLVAPSSMPTSARRATDRATGRCPRSASSSETTCSSRLVSSIAPPWRPAFEDADALVALERIVHPEVRKLVDQALGERRGGRRAVRRDRGHQARRRRPVRSLRRGVAHRVFSGDQRERLHPVVTATRTPAAAFRCTGWRSRGPPRVGAGRPPDAGTSRRRLSTDGSLDETREPRRGPGGRRRQGLAHLTAPHLNAGRTTRTFGVRWRDFR